MERTIAENGPVWAPRRSKLGKRIRKLIEIAKKYEAEREAAITQSGLREAIDELQWAATDLESLAWDIRGIKPSTMVGVMIQARALVAHGEAQRFDGHCGLILGRDLASSLLRVTEAQS